MQLAGIAAVSLVGNDRAFARAFDGVEVFRRHFTRDVTAIETGTVEVR